MRFDFEANVLKQLISQCCQKDVAIHQVYRTLHINMLTSGFGPLF